ncbi:MAG: proline racemase family protein [Pseudomonadota bacterium]
MNTNKLIHVVGCHAEGEVGDVVVGGVAPPPGDTLWAQSRYLDKDGKLKAFLLNEPRGGLFRHINILTPPKNPRADIGNIILEPETTPPMSGSNAICVATVVLETGILPIEEPITRFGLEMPGGLVDICARCRDGKVESVELTNIASFVDRVNAPLEVAGHGTLSVDILFGGDSFVALDASTLGFSLVPDEARALAELGIKIARAADEQIGFQHPTLREMNEITFCLMTQPAKVVDSRRIARHCVAIRPGKIDRSPTGTAVSARLALMHSRGEATVGDEVVFQSVLGSEFVGGIQSETEINGKTAIRPSVRGRAWITGMRQLMLDPDDPWPTGYRLSDTWPRYR